MAERIKKHWEIILVSGLGLILAIVGLWGIMGWENLVYSDVSTTVTVTARVQEQLSFTSNTTTVELVPDLIDNSAVLHVGSSTVITLTVGTNSADGYSITVAGNDDLGLTSGGNNIQLATATGTATAGSDAYGIQSTSSDMTITSLYWFATSTDNIGRTSTTAAKMATDASPGTSQRAYVVIKASCDIAQPTALNYTDTLTFTAIATP